MKLSNETLTVLKNYSIINPNCVVKPGNVLKTISSGNNIYSQIQIQETFDKEFGIYDLGKFLATLSLFKNPELTFTDKKVVISDGNAKIDYFYSETSLLKVPPSAFKMPEVDFSFELKSKDLSELNKAGAVLQAPDISILANSVDKTIQLTVHDKKDETSNKYSLMATTHSFTEGVSVMANVHLKIENLKLISDDYVVNISRKNVAEFLGKNTKIKYYISLETSSKWNY